MIQRDSLRLNQGCLSLEPVAKMVGTGTPIYLHQEALGSTRLETTSTVTVKFSSNYAPYGSNYAISGKEVFMDTGKRAL